MSGFGDPKGRRWLGSFRKESRGFTLVEVLVAATVLAFATFGLMWLLKLSDQSAFRARAAGQAANIFKSRTTVLVSLPISFYAYTLSWAPGVGSGGVRNFARGGVIPIPSGASVVSPGTGQSFPFFDVVDPNALVYFFKSRPTPGTTTLRDIFPYREELTLTFKDASGGVVSSVGEAKYLLIEYKLIWLDSFSGQTKSLDFSFVKGGTYD